MTAMIALIRREQIEHRGAFLFAPAILLVLFTVAIASAFAFNKARIPFAVTGETSLKFFQVAFMGMSFLWFAYLMVALFFYFADAFHADRRNNAMLFWKSMPQSDFKILMSKMLAALTILPLQIFALVIVTGLVLYGFTVLATLMMPALTIPGIGAVLGASGQVLLFSLVSLVLALLWYAPFFAWVGALSTVVGRWSIPLAFLIPGLAILAENLFVRGLIDFFVPTDGLRGGFILNYLRERATFGVDDGDMFERAFKNNEALDVMGLLNRFVAEIDWVQMGGGLIVAALLVYAASEYRRRVTLT
jgi:ABC-2 type transport system permease protein